MSTTESAPPEPAAAAADQLPGDGLILDPNAPGFDHLEPRDREAIEATIAWFEERGKVALKDADREHRWYSDYLAFQAQEGIFSRFLTPARDGGGDPERRWDTQRICAFNEVSAFYGLAYWYTWQVTILGLGPIFQSENEAARARAARLLEGGEIFAFGLSERAHGADIYSTDMVLSPNASGDGWMRQRRQVLHRQRQRGGDGLRLRADRGHRGADGYAFFAADSRHPNYELIRNVVNSQNYVSQFELRDYPVDAGGRPPHRSRRLRRGAEHGQHRQVQPRLRLDRDLRARPPRGDHPRRLADPLRDPGDRLPARPPGVHRQLRPADRDEAVRRTGRSTTCGPPRPRTAATCSSTR